MRRPLIALLALVLVACSGGNPAGPDGATPRPTLGWTPAELIAGLADEDADVRLAAAQRLAASGDATAVPALAVAARDADYDVSRAALDALAAIGGTQAEAALVGLAATGPAIGDLVEKDWFTDVVAALGKVATGPDAIARLLELWVSEDTTIVGGPSLAAGEALDRLTVAAVPGLTAALDATDEAVRFEAIARLGRVGGPDAAAALLGLVSSKTLEVRKAAIDALGDAGDPSAGAALVKALADNAVRANATNALYKIYAEDATPLLKYLKAKATIRVYEAVIRIGQDGTEAALITALDKYGSVPMAEDYLNCGNAKLDAAAHKWATRHGYTVTTVPGGGAVTWGK